MESLNPLAVKKCSNCFKVKPREQFYRKLNGLQSRCKACNREVVRGYHNRTREKLGIKPLKEKIKNEIL